MINNKKVSFKNVPRDSGVLWLSYHWTRQFEKLRQLVAVLRRHVVPDSPQAGAPTFTGVLGARSRRLTRLHVRARLFGTCERRFAGTVHHARAGPSRNGPDWSLSQTQSGSGGGGGNLSRVLWRRRRRRRGRTRAVSRGASSEPAASPAAVSGRLCHWLDPRRSHDAP